MSRARLYSLFDAFEIDIRTILARWVLSELTEEQALGDLFDRASRKRSQDSTSDPETSLTFFLDLREGYDLLNRHRAKLPSDLATEVRELTNGLDRLVPIRNRVMHSRPLNSGDPDTAILHLGAFTSSHWPELKRVLGHLNSNPLWEPTYAVAAQQDRILHNLPLPEYDETGLVGRGREVTDLVQLLRRRRESVVTITGEGGIGKTALALEVAYRLVDDPESPFEAILWTSLKHARLTSKGVEEITGAARSVFEAVRPIGEALDSSFDGTIAELASALDGLEVLIVFDNLESVGGGEFRALYDALPDSVTYLVTSRIGVGELERRYPLAPLSSGDAVKLFSDLVRARRQDRLEKLTPGAREQLVAKLRCSPLAIRWYLQALETGKDPLTLARNQDELLEFCVRDVYDSLSQVARQILACLQVFNRAATPEEVVLLLELPIDEVNAGLQELVRGSLVMRETSSNGDSLVSRMTLTSTAAEFLDRPRMIDENMRLDMDQRAERYRVLEERRASEASSRSMNPIVVRTDHPHQAPAAQTLRRALLLSNDGSYEKALAEVQIARSMAPDLWEVDRVEAFIRSSAGQFDAASDRYEAGYRRAGEHGRAVIAHFYAGHLSNKMRDNKRAIELELEAHNFLNNDDTAIALGNYLVRDTEFSAGITLLAPIAASTHGRQQLIAVNSLASAYRRWAEYAASQEHNPLAQCERALQGLDIAWNLIELGVVDSRLTDVAVSCAIEFINGTNRALLNATPVPSLPGKIESIERKLVRMTTAERWPRLASAVRRLCTTSNPPPAVLKLDRAILQLSQNVTNVAESSEASLLGEIVSVVNNTYGFIRHQLYPNNLFFHINDVVSGTDIAGLVPGARIHFVPAESDRGPRAFQVELAG